MCVPPHPPALYPGVPPPLQVLSSLQLFPGCHTDQPPDTRHKLFAISSECILFAKIVGGPGRSVNPALPNAIIFTATCSSPSIVWQWSTVYNRHVPCAT